MKKIISIMLILLVGLTIFSGCGVSNNQSNEENAESYLEAYKDIIETIYNAEDFSELVLPEDYKIILESNKENDFLKQIKNYVEVVQKNYTKTLDREDITISTFKKSFKTSHAVSGKTYYGPRINQYSFHFENERLYLQINNDYGDIKIY